MASFMSNSLPLFLLFLAFSLQIQARESQFFNKVSPASIAEEPATELPPQSHNGYGLYGRDPNNFPSTTTTKNSYNYNYNNNNNKGHAYMEPTKNPSTLTNPEFSTENYENGEKRNVNSYSSPLTYSDEEFRRYESKNEPNYSQYDKQQQYGMSDTRSLENGKYFYDVNAERYGRGYEPTRGNTEEYGGGYEPTKGNTEEYGGGYKPTKGNTEEYGRGYEPTKENTETYGRYGNEEGRDGYEYKKEMSQDEYEP